MTRAATLLPPAFLAPAFLAVSTLAGLAIPSAQAMEIKFPKDKPRVMFEVPDGWSVTETPIGLELRSPEKNSLIVANLLKRTRSVVDAWNKKATEALIETGVTFDRNAKSPPAPVTPEKPVVPGTLADVLVNPFTISGDPAPEMNSVPPSINQPQDGPVVTMPDSVSGIAHPDRPKIPFRVVQYYGASVASKPVDVQLVVFKLDRDDLFLMEQESTSDDSRAVGIVASVKLVR